MNTVYKTILKVADPKCYCGEVKCFLILDERDYTEWLKEKFQLEDTSNYILFQLSIFDGDDFGGSYFYPVPKERVEECKTFLINWAENLKEKAIKPWEFYEEDFTPVIKGIKSYNNW